MDIKILILTALIGVIAAFSHAGKSLSRSPSKAEQDRPVLPI
jgi:hypothetical protein